MNPPTSPSSSTSGSSAGTSTTSPPPGAPAPNKRARKPCSNCINSKVACDQQRPCGRCTKQGRQSTCKDVPRKQRNKKPREEVVSDESLDSPTSVPSSMFHAPPSMRANPQPHHIHPHHSHTPLHSAPFSALHVPRATSPTLHSSASAPASYVWSPPPQTLSHSHSYPPTPPRSHSHDSVPQFYEKSSTMPNERLGSTIGAKVAYPVLPHYNYKMPPSYYPPQHKFPASHPGYSSELHDFLLPNPDSAPASYVSPYALPPTDSPQHFHPDLHSPSHLSHLSHLSSHISSHAPSIHPSTHPSTHSSSHPSTGTGSTNCTFIPSHFPAGTSPREESGTPSPPTPHEPSTPTPNLTWHMTDPYTLSFPAHHSSLALGAPNMHATHTSHASHSTHSSHSPHPIHDSHPASHAPHSSHPNITNITNISNINHINITNPSYPPPTTTSTDHAQNPLSLHTISSSNSANLQLPHLAQPPQHSHNFPPQESHGQAPGYPQTSPLAYASEEPTFMVMMSTRVLVDCNMGFARLLGYDTPTSLVMGNGLVLLEELSPPQFQKYIMNTWKNVMDQRLKRFERFTCFKTRSGNILFCTFTANVLDDNMHGIAVITQAMDYADLPPVLKSKLNDALL